MATAQAVQENSKRRKRGPKKRIKDSVRVTIYIPGLTLDILEKIGMGNVSHGARVAVQAYEEQHGTEVVPELLVSVK